MCGGGQQGEGGGGKRWRVTWWEGGRVVGVVGGCGVVGGVVQLGWWQGGSPSPGGWVDSFSFFLGRFMNVSSVGLGSGGQEGGGLRVYAIPDTGPGVCVGPVGEDPPAPWTCSPPGLVASYLPARSCPVPT